MSLIFEFRDNMIYRVVSGNAELHRKNVSQSKKRKKWIKNKVNTFGPTWTQNLDRFLSTVSFLFFFYLKIEKDIVL